MTMIKAAAPRTLTIGGHTFDWDPVNNANDIHLVSYANGAGTPRSSARNGVATAGYQVPAGKTLKVIAAKLIANNNVLSQVNIAQTDNDLGISSATAPTNPVYLGGSTVAAICAANTYGATNEVGGMSFYVAATKYLSVSNIAGTAEVNCTHLYCKLV